MKKKKSSNHSFILLSAIVLVLLATGIYLKRRSDANSAKNKQTQSANIDNATPVKDFQFSAELKPMQDRSGSGEAGASFQNGSFRLKAVAKDLPELKEGQLYKAWLRSPDDDKKFVEVGALKFNEFTKSWGIQFAATSDLTSYKKVVVTIQGKDSKPEPAESVLEGMLEKS